jgi:PAS domain S-box-containing protein
MLQLFVMFLLVAGVAGVVNDSAPQVPRQASLLPGGGLDAIACIERRRPAIGVSIFPTANSVTNLRGVATRTMFPGYLSAATQSANSRPAVAHHLGKIPFVEVVWHYLYLLIAAFVLLLLLAGSIAYVLRLNRRLEQSKRSLQNEISKRRQDEQALRQSEGVLHTLHDLNSLHTLPLEGKIQALLSLGCNQFGMPVGILSKAVGDQYEVKEIVAPDDRIVQGKIFPISQTYCSKTLQDEGPVCFEHAAVSEWANHPAYRTHRLEAYFGIRIDVDGGVYGTLNFVSPEPRRRPFTDGDKEILKHMAQWIATEIQRQRAEAHIRKLSGALEHSADVVVIVSSTGIIEYVNPAFERITGYSREEAIGHSPDLLRSGLHGVEFYQRLWQTIQRGESFHDTFINRRKDGVLYYEEKTITPLKDAHGKVLHFVSTGKDVTQRRLAEEKARVHQAELAHVCRVSAMGEMAAAIAHELNQPLAAIVNYAQGGLHRLRAGDARLAELQYAFEHIAALGSQSGEIIRRTRGFLRKGEPQRTRAQINDIVLESIELANLEARQKDVTLRLKLASELPPVSADVIQIEQVVLNLVHNAIEAIDAASTPQREVTIQTTRGPANGVDVAVCDTGPGLPAGDTESIFDAFFTTKPDGMGMGLCISRSIIESYGEQLRAATNPEGGATFHFSLPALDEENVS